MHSTLFLGAAVFSAAAFAQISIDINEGARVVSDVEAFVASVTANPAFQSDISALASAIPSSVIAAAEQNPEAFAEAILTATTLPSWVSAIPTAALGSLETLAAKPIKAGEDLVSYVGSVIDQPGFSSVASVLATAVPSSVVAQLEADPASFVQAQITANGPPAYITALPPDVQSDIGSFINAGLSIAASDLEASSVSVAPFSQPSVKPTGTGTGVYYQGSSTSSPIAFTGAASSINANLVCGSVIAAFGVFLALL